MSIDTPTGAAASVWQQLQSEKSSGFGASTGLQWHPGELDACVQARGAALPDPLRADEIEELRAAHERWGGDEASFASIGKLSDPNTRVVVTGQQPGLLAGPLLVLYKTIAAVRLCRDLTARHPGLNFVTVFWVASEDQDFDEVRRVMWAGHAGSLEEVLMPHPTGIAGQMVGPLPTAAIAEELACRIESSTHKTEFQAAALELVRRAYGNADMETGFCRILLAFLKQSGIVIVSPLMNWVRRRSAAIVAHELQNPGESSRLVIERGEQLRAQGIEPALHRAEGSINVFWIDEQQRRHALKLENGKIIRRLAASGEGDGNGAEAVDHAELVAMLKSSPERFSLNVVTRPLAQDRLLPTVAQVVGPGEAAYLAQVEAVYESFGVFAPVRYPRPQVLLVEPRVERQLAKYKLTLNEALGKDAGQLAEMVLRRDSLEGDVGQVEALQRRQKEELEALRKRMPQDPSVQDAFEKLNQVMEKAYGKILERILYLRQRDEGHLTKAMGVVANSLQPGGADQERALNPVAPFVVNHGLDWAGKISPMLAMAPDGGTRIIRLAELMENGSNTTKNEE